MEFPPRTGASDAIANNLFNALTAAAPAVPNGGANRCMVTVLTVNEVGGVPAGAFIATSGPAAVAGGLRTAINNQATNGLFAAVAYHIITFSSSGAMIRPFNSALPGAGGYLLAGPRHCAEPKAIERAAATGQRLSGMTTFWWGNVVNPYPDPTNNPAGIFALPCDVCRANERWIMARAEEARVQARSGAPRRSLEV
jgi:hypothetical protein